MASRARKPIPRKLQVEVFRRDYWLCRYCGIPIIFDPSFKLLERFLKDNGVNKELAYYHLNRRRDRSPLLDQLGVAVDHDVPHSSGGTDDIGNLRTACNKCNSIKSATDRQTHETKNPKRKVKGLHGEPTNWDGFSNLFLVLASQYASELTESERDWVLALA